LTLWCFPIGGEDVFRLKSFTADAQETMGILGVDPMLRSVAGAEKSLSAWHSIYTEDYAAFFKDAFSSQI
jgi:hypothetical protein